MPRRGVRRTEILALIAGGMVSTACVTLPPYRSVQLPAYASGYFSECAGRDGAVSFSFMHNAQSSGNLDLEWAANSRGEWTLASYSPMGQTLFQVEFSKNPPQLNKTGRQSNLVDDLNVGKDGYLRYEGQLLGLRADEIACLLDRKLPRTWLKQVVAETAEEHGLRLVLQDKERLMTLRLVKHGSSLPMVWTVDIGWSMYFGLKREALKAELEKSGRIHFSSLSRPEISSIMTLREDEF